LLEDIPNNPGRRRAQRLDVGGVDPALALEALATVRCEDGLPDARRPVQEDITAATLGCRPESSEDRTHGALAVE
jgi:hypothetical protein